VHRGHAEVLRDAKDAVLTFDPHPAVALGRVAPSILTALPRKIELLERAGASEVVVQRFDDAFASWSPERFVTDLLVRQLAATVVVVGRNFRFGNKRAGDLATLEKLGQAHGFAVRPFDLRGDEVGPFSSTRVRDAIGRGDIDDATRVLGRPHAFSGTVAKGDQRGRTIGFPTANVDDVTELVPASGVYAVVVDRIDHFTKAVGRGVMNVGVRPTVKDAGRRTQEVHLFDFDQDLYGAKLRVHVVSRIREERKFASIDELRAQIALDASAARAITSQIEPKIGGAFG
jgi:riboflavin kinase/FMN adenylyltransferase